MEKTLGVTPSEDFDIALLEDGSPGPRFGVAFADDPNIFDAKARVMELIERNLLRGHTNDNWARHKIKVQPGFELPWSRAYPHTQSDLDFLSEWLKKQLEKQVVRKVSMGNEPFVRPENAACLPVFIVGSTTRKPRVVINLKGLNQGVDLSGLTMRDPSTIPDLVRRQATGTNIVTGKQIGRASCRERV